MARTTVEDVLEILDDSTIDETILEGYINSANIFVTAQLAGKSLSSDLLKEIERWMTAHMVASTRERQIKKAGAGGGVEVEYTGYWSTGLNGTTYGQTAVLLDTSGTLTALAQGKLPAWSKAVPTPKTV
jgi:hypothetical protein